MVSIKKFSCQKKCEGRTLHDMWPKKTLEGGTLHDILHEELMCQMTHFQHLTFMHSCRVSERREGKRERQVMPPLELLIKFFLLSIIFQVSFSFNLLVAFCQNFGRQIFFSLAMATKMVTAWSAARGINFLFSPD